MRISHTRKFVFLAHPRTASRAVRQVLDPYSEILSVERAQSTSEHPWFHHMPAAQAAEAFTRCGWDWSAYLKFLVVRNPFERVPSLYRWFQSHNPDIQIGFDQFVEKNVQPWQIMYMSARRFSSNAEGEVLVDRFLRHENLTDDMNEVCDALDLPRIEAVPSLGAGEGGGYRDFYSSSETLERVAHLYRDDIEAFGFTYERPGQV